MKKLFILATASLLSLSSFAGLNCSINADMNADDNYDTVLAEYTDIETSVSTTVVTLINTDGSVEKNVDPDMIGSTDRDSGTKAVFINVDIVSEKLTLTTATTNEMRQFLQADQMAIGNSSAEFLGLLDLKDKISIVCLNQ